MEKLKAFINDYGGAVVVWLFLLLLIILSSCTRTIREVVEVPKVHTEYITNHTTDSIFLKDSIYVNQYIKGDTVYKEKEVIRYKSKNKVSVDTLIVRDTIVPPAVINTLREQKKAIEEYNIKYNAQKKVSETYRWIGLILLLLLFLTNYKVVWAIIKKVF